MQFREAGDRVKIMRYEGYNAVRKRGDVRMIGSFDRRNYELSDGLLGKLSDEEKAELNAEIERRKAERIARSRAGDMKSATVHLAAAARLLPSGMTFEDAVGELTAEQVVLVWQSIKALEKTLEAAGHPRPKRQYKAPAAA